MEATLERSIPAHYLPLATRASTELKTWHVGCYFRQYQEALTSLKDKALASSILEDAIRRDAYGQIVENIVAQKDEKGKFIFDLTTRISVQVTPVEHEYVADKQVIDPETGLPMVMGPEHLLLGKPVRSTFTNFRRDLDRRAAALWMKEFITAEDGTIIRWASPIAGPNEERVVRDNCHEYGYGYIGTKSENDRYIRLQVLDARTWYQARAYEHYILNSSDRIIKEKGNEVLDEVDRTMTTIGMSKTPTTDEQILRELSESDQATGGKGLVFGLEVDDAIPFLDRALHRRLRDEAAKEVARWTVDQIVSGVSEEEIQQASRAKFIQATQAVIEETKYQVKVEQSDHRLKNRNNYSKLENFTGFSGDFCASEGGSETVIINGEVYLRIESGQLIKGVRCPRCGEVNICKTKYCYKDDCHTKLPESLKASDPSFN